MFLASPAYTRMAPAIGVDLSRGSKQKAFFPSLPFHSPPARRCSRPRHLVVQNFKFMKQLGLKKPSFLPDFGLEKRKAVIDRFYTSFDAATLNELLADDLQIVETESVQPYGKKEWVRLISEHVKPAIPDFSWSHITTGEKDDDGYSIVRIQAVGHHTGEPFTLPGNKYPPVVSTGQRFRLAEQTVKVKVEDGKIKEIQYLPKQGTGPLALYMGLGGRVPSNV